MAVLLQNSSLKTIRGPRPSLTAYEQEVARRRAIADRERIAADVEGIRHKCKTLIGFVREFWHILEPAKQFKEGWVIQAICDHLEAVADGRIQYLLINVPPGTMKSLLTAVFMPAWVWATQDASRQFLTSSFARPNVIRDNAKMRRLVECEKYQALFPHVRLDPSSNAKEKFETMAMGFREGRAFEGMTGGRADCLLAGSIIDTDQGPLAIDAIVNGSISCNVLSYDKHSDRLVYRPVEAVARRSSLDFYRIHLAGGGVVECTGNHRFHTARGYREARLLSGDDVLMRALPGAGSGECVPAQEGRKGGISPQVLQPEMRTERDQCGGGEVRLSVQGVRGQNTERPSPMFAGMQGDQHRADECGAGFSHPGKAMRDLQPDISAEVAQERGAVLFADMRGSGPFGGHAGGEQPRMAQRDERTTLHEHILEPISQVAPEDIGARQSSMRRLSDDRRPVRSSHRHGPEPERVAEFGHALPILPYEIPCHRAFGVAREAVALVERVCQPAVVYDLQVAGTRCFFANGVLVHNCVIIDDPHSVTGGESETQRESTVQTFREAIPDRLNDMTKSSIIVIMQRLHANDVAGEILKLKLPYVHLNLPMLFESTKRINGVEVDARCRTFDRFGKPLFVDPRQRDGELLFPERFPQAEVDALRHVKGSYAWAGQYMQSPTAREGGLFKRHWFSGKIIDKASLPPRPMKFCRAWDLAATDEAGDGDPDYTAGLLMAREGVDYYIFDVKHDRLSAGGVQMLIKSTAETDPRGTIVRIPQDPGQAGKDQAGSYVRALAGYALKIETTSGRGDKVGRAVPLSIQAEFGHVYLVNSGPPSEGIDPWIEPFLDELCAFPKANHDDRVDAASDSFSELAIGSTEAFEAQSAGTRTIIAAAERDSRYRFGDNAAEEVGRMSAPSRMRGIL